MIGVREFEDELGATMRGVAGDTSAPAGLPDRLIDNVVTPHRKARRPARRWYVPAMAAAAVVLVTVGIAVTVSQAPGDRDRAPAAASTAVPWTDVGARPVAISEFGMAAGLDDGRPKQARQGTRLCVDTDFRLISAQSADTTDGWVSTSFILRSVASTNCAVSVRGSEGSAVLTDASGGVLPDNLPVVPGSYIPDLLVRPGQLVAGGANWAWDGHSSARPARLVILAQTDSEGTRPDPRLSVSLAAVSIPRNPISPIVVNGVRAAISVAVLSGFQTVFDPGSLGSLDAVIHAPATIGLGSVVRYTVTLRNNTDVPVGLKQCPDVLQVLAVVPVKQSIAVGVRSPLNCANGPAMIEPNSTVTFAFEINSTGVVAGDGGLTWSLATGNHTALTVTAQIKVSP